MGTNQQYLENLSSCIQISHCSPKQSQRRWGPAKHKRKISDRLEIHSPLLELCLRNWKRLEQPLLQLIDILGLLANGTSTHKLVYILDQGRPPNPLLKGHNHFANTKMSGIMGIVQFLKKHLLKTMSWGNH